MKYLKHLLLFVLLMMVITGSVFGGIYFLSRPVNPKVEFRRMEEVVISIYDIDIKEEYTYTGFIQVRPNDNKIYLFEARLTDSKPIVGVE